MSSVGRWIIPLSDVPATMAIHQYILKFTDLKEKMNLFAQFDSSYRKVSLQTDIEPLKKSVLEGVEQFGLHQFKYENSSASIDGPYLSASLTWNPDAIDKISSDPHMATLGSSSLKWNSASLYSEATSETAYRNSYLDTYSFVERTPISNHKAINDLLNSFKNTLVRSRISTIKAQRAEATKFDFCWHNDESIFLNLRINIPIQTSPNYAIQIIQKSDGEDLEMEEFSMKQGMAYVYDSGKNHRPFCKQLDSIDRIHMICGVSPWFDFDKKNQCWVSNQYYGEMHPFEMFSNGLISPIFMK